MNLNTPDPVQLSVHRHGTCGAVWRLDVGDAGVGRAAWCPDRAARRIAGGGPWQAPLSTLGPALDRLRKLPDWLWLAPREDAFVASADPARRAELLLMMRHLLGRDVDVALTTRGGLREGRELVALAAAAPGRVAVRVGLFTRDLALEARWEDGLAPASQRIALASALVDAGAAVTLELGPIIPFVNDAPRALDGVMRAAARAHVRHVAPRWIEDAPGLLLQVEREVGRSSARMLSGWFRQPGAQAERGGRRGIAPDARSSRRQHIHEAARDHGITVVECRCVHHGASAACPVAPSRLVRPQLDLQLPA
ncbi:MAG: hypothetical protein CVU56_24035 [Deltaproteobacteria bacterium HGW-Deltaproteobacteria-14]|jgi:hypothetical protein|nr:MAG: hypothetical protein CVU56_24035 [Deltaproteobacteria bacterium HGW-Deltaproteobacteria-14]